MSGHKSYSFTRPAALKKIEKALELLVSPRSAQELAEMLYLAKRTTTMYLDHLRAKPRRVRIAQWFQGEAGPPVALFQVGAAADEPRPPAKSRTERSREHRARLGPGEASRRRAERREKRPSESKAARRERMIGQPTKPDHGPTKNPTLS